MLGADTEEVALSFENTSQNQSGTILTDMIR